MSSPTLGLTLTVAQDPDARCMLCSRLLTDPDLPAVPIAECTNPDCGCRAIVCCEDELREWHSTAPLLLAECLRTLEGMRLLVQQQERQLGEARALLRDVVAVADSFTQPPDLWPITSARVAEAHKFLGHRLATPAEQREGKRWVEQE